jgi:antitoxin component YwqK of YwqJK toxin-antitoxin module
MVDTIHSLTKLKIFRYHRPYGYIVETINFTLMNRMRILFCLILVLAAEISSAQTTKWKSFQVYNGDTINCVDQKGMKQGVWKKFYETKKVLGETTFKNNVQVGISKSFFESGKIQAEIKNSTDGKSARVVMYYESGKIHSKGNYKMQKKDSVWNYYSEDSLLTKVESYKAGVRDGKWIVYYENGVKAEEKTFVNDKINGWYIQYAKNGNKIFEQEIINDIENGIVRVYGAEGKIKTVGKFKNGLRDGNWQDMDAMGRTLKKYTYVNGKLPDEDK